MQRRAYLSIVKFTQDYDIIFKHLLFVQLLTCPLFNSHRIRSTHASNTILVKHLMAGTGETNNGPGNDTGIKTER